MRRDASVSTTGASGGSRTSRARLRAPSLPGALVRRPALEARLDEAFGKRLTMVVAGPGFGKSTLLAAWTHDLEAAWYTVGPDDAAIGNLGRGIIEAVQARVPAFVTELGGVSAGGGATTIDEELESAEALGAHLCETLDHTLRHDLVLVIDDAHELGESRVSARLLETLCRQAPDALHLVLSSRAATPFPIERLRGQGHVLEVECRSDLAP